MFNTRANRQMQNVLPLRTLPEGLDKFCTSRTCHALKKYCQQLFSKNIGGQHNIGGTATFVEL